MISNFTFWSMVLSLGLGTILIRGLFIFFSSKIQVSERMKQLFSFIPAAVLPAFIAPAVFFHKGQSEWLANQERIVVAIVAVGVALYSKSTLWTILIGMLLLTLLQTFQM